MKWPASLTLIRHAKSAYNALRDAKNADPEYARFKEAYEHDYRSVETRQRAFNMRKKYALGKSDFETPLCEEGIAQAKATGKRLSGIIPPPDVIFYSPYLRVVDTHKYMAQGWLDLEKTRRIEEDRIREQEHGLSLLYSDWRIFHSMHPEQKELHDLLGPYWYQYPQGESVSQVRDRSRDVLSMLVRECAGLHVVLETHHLTILSMRANLERLTPEQFINLDEHDKPVNCGVTHYVGNPSLGVNGKLALKFYNTKLY